LKKSRILHVYKLYYPDNGGIQTVMRALVTGLQSHFEQYILVSRARGLGRVDTVDGITVRRTMSLATLLAMPIAPFFPLWFWFQAMRSDVVDYHYPFPLVDLAISLFFPKKTQLIIHWHADIVSQQRALKWVAPLIRRCLKRADRIVVATPIHIDNSPFLREVREKCVVIPYAISVADWSSLSAINQQEVSRLQQTYPKLLLAIGRLVPYKGFEIAIKAMQTVDAYLVIVGVGPLANSLQALAAELGVAQKVIFWGEASHEQLLNLLHAATLLVFPSVLPSEAFGMVQLEAMACGKAIINTALASGVPWVARHDQEALTVPVGDSKALAEAINRLLVDNQYCQQLGQNGLARAKTIFDMPQFLAATVKVYEQ